MAGLTLRHVYKLYQSKEKQKKCKKNNTDKRRNGDFLAVKDFNMEIEDGEVIVFVGPSGCGKSTTLRMIAGLEDITAGDLYIGDRFVNDVEPKDRDIAMVFQNYALYPHMTAGENIAFGLRMRKIPVEKTDENGNLVKAINKKKISEVKRGLNTVIADLRYAEESDTEAVFKRKLLVIKDEYLLMLSQMANETANKQGEELKKVKAKYAETEKAISDKVNRVLAAQKAADL